MITISKTDDYALIKKICTQPLAYDVMSDDNSPPREKWEPLEDPNITYLAVKNGEAQPIGIFALVPENSVCWKVHICMAPLGFGDSREAFLELFRWVWQYTGCLRLVGYVAERNRLALNLALAVGMKTFGFNPDSWLKNGVLQGQVLVGISKPPEAT